jgi:hypothetical protein
MGLPLSRILSASLALAILTPINLGRAQSPESPPFAPGETLTYDVDWTIFTAGRVVATLEDPGKNGHPTKIAASARSQGFAALLFKLQDYFEAYFDPQTLCSQRISKKVSENSRHREINITFNHARGVAIQEDRDLNTLNAPPKHVENKIPGCVEDIVTAFYFLRHQNFHVGQDIHMALNDGGETHEVTIEVQAREQLQTPVGNRFAYRLEPRIFGSLYSKKGRMLVWMSDDAQHLPLRIRMSISVGSFTGNLLSVTTSPGNQPPTH